MRLDRFVAKALGVSRKEARKLIRDGRVTIDGKTVTDPSFSVKGGVVALDGKPLETPRKVYLALFKPAGYLSTTERDGPYPSFLELLGESFRGRRLFAAGRLDAPSRGLLIVTDDGQLAHAVTHPKRKVEKEYLVKLDKPFKEELTALRAVEVEGKPVAVKEAELVDEDLLRLVLTEGRYRIIRRLMKALGYEVEDLLRVRVGPVRLEGLKEGTFRPLTEEELELLKREAGIIKGA
ncbi:MAG: rRNA pseudouridine synthase [Aquificae bacterium]|nr:rRNA pseudouridine synthase [Aquificota bacterium]